MFNSLEKILPKADRERYDDLILKLARQGTRDEFHSFVYCTSDYLHNDPKTTGLASEMLINELAKINGRKVVILDTCHSGGIVNPVRGLTPGGRGPTIFASCGQGESSYEDDPKFNKNYNHGLFSYAILEALRDPKSQLTSDTMTAPDLQLWLDDRVNKLVKTLDENATQNPISFPQTLPKVELARRQK